MRAAAAPVLALVLASALAPLGCLGGGQRNEPIRYWVLNGLAGPPGTEGPRVTVGVGPVDLPDHLRRRGIVVRDGENRLRISAIDQWGEPLGQGIPRVLAENLAVLSPGMETVPFPWWSPAPPDLQVSIVITRLDARPGAEIELLASWVISRPADGRPLSSGTTWIREPLEGRETADVVAGLSRLLERWSRELLAALQTAAPEPAAAASAPEG